MTTQIPADKLAVIEIVNAIIEANRLQNPNSTTDGRNVIQSHDKMAAIINDAIVEAYQIMSSNISIGIQNFTIQELVSYCYNCTRVSHEGEHKSSMSQIGWYWFVLIGLLLLIVMLLAGVASWICLDVRKTKKAHKEKGRASLAPTTG